MQALNRMQSGGLDHPPSRSGQVFRAEFCEAHQLVAIFVAGIFRKEKSDMRIRIPALWHARQITAQLLGVTETDDSLARKELVAEEFSRQLVAQTPTGIGH